MFVRWLATLVLLVSLPLAGSAAPQSKLVVLQPWEHGGAQIQLSRVRTLTQQLSKQNLLYQLHMGDLQKSDLVLVADEIDVSLKALADGSPTLAVPPPPNKAVREAIAALDDAWGPLRRLAVASPFDYARREHVAIGNARADPLLIRHFDDLVEKVDQRAATAKQRYVEECERVRGPDCSNVARATAGGPLSERLVKEAVLVFAGIEPEANAARLRKSRDLLGRTLELAVTLEPVRATMSPERGKIGDAVSGLWDVITANWGRLNGQVDLLLTGHADQFDVGQTVALQKIMLHDIQRFSVAVQRFAVGRRAVSAGPL